MTRQRDARRGAVCPRRRQLRRSAPRSQVRPRSGGDARAIPRAVVPRAHVRSPPCRRRWVGRASTPDHPGAAHGAHGGARRGFGVRAGVRCGASPGWEPERFVRDLVVGSLHARIVVVGQNFRFGAKRAGDMSLLTKLGAELGFEVRVHATAADARGPYSSTRAREAIVAGEMEEERRGAGPSARALRRRRPRGRARPHDRRPHGQPRSGRRDAPSGRGVRRSGRRARRREQAPGASRVESRTSACAPP